MEEKRTGWAIAPWQENEKIFANDFLFKIQEDIKIKQYVKL